MSAPDWNDLKADGRVVFDYPDRKLAVYSNTSGGVVTLSVEDGRATYSTLEDWEIPAFLDAFCLAANEAQAISAEMDAEYETHLALERAKGAAA